MSSSPPFLELRSSRRSSTYQLSCQAPRGAASPSQLPGTLTRVTPHPPQVAPTVRRPRSQVRTRRGRRRAALEEVTLWPRAAARGGARARSERRG